MDELIKLPLKEDLEQPSILKELVLAHRHLAELKGIVHSIPNEKILLLNLTLQEAKDSSAIENIITTQDSLYKYSITAPTNSPDKELHNYSKALLYASKKVNSEGGISCNSIIEIQRLIDPKRSGFRKVPGTVIKNLATNQVVYTPPTPEKIPDLMAKLENFINDQESTIDPIIKMALIHLYFESIHPFYDGNGRTGRIINILYLLLNKLLDSPVLYLSRYILRHRSEYYRLLQYTREKEDWTDWIIYILKAVSVISQETTNLIQEIEKLFREYKKVIRENYKFYSQDLINNIFSYPYTTVKILEKETQISRATATRYLDTLAKDKLLEKKKLGRGNYYINKRLFNILKDS